MKISQLILMSFVFMSFGCIDASDYSRQQYIKDCLLLELNPDENFTTRDINRSYKKLSLVYHPDKYEGSAAYWDGYSKEDAEEKFKRIGNAKDRLMDYKNQQSSLSLMNDDQIDNESSFTSSEYSSPASASSPIVEFGYDVRGNYVGRDGEYDINGKSIYDYLR